MLQPLNGSWRKAPDWMGIVPMNGSWVSQGSTMALPGMFAYPQGAAAESMRAFLMPSWQGPADAFQGWGGFAAAHDNMGLGPISSEYRQEVLLAEALGVLAWSGERKAHGPVDRLTLTFAHGEAHKIERPSIAALTAQLPAVEAAAADRNARAAEIHAQASGFLGFFVSVLPLEPSRCPATCELLSLAMALGSVVSQRIKSMMGAPRPYQLSPRILPMLPTPVHASFPMGHAVQAFMAAALLKQIIDKATHVARPKRLEAVTAAWKTELCGADGAAGLLERVAQRIADNRVVAGLHFPLDLEAGRALGTFLAEAVPRQVDATLQLGLPSFIGRMWDAAVEEWAPIVEGSNVR